MAKDTIIDPEWEDQMEMRGKWGTRPRKAEPEDLDPFGVDKAAEPELIIESASDEEDQDEYYVVPPFDPDPPKPQRRSRTSLPEPEPNTEPEPEPDSFAAPEEKIVSRSKEIIGMFLSGSILSKAEVRRSYPIMLVIAVFMFLYIARVFRMQELHRMEIQLTRQVEVLRARSLDIASRRMHSTRQSVLIEELERREIPLVMPQEPPKIIEP